MIKILQNQSQGYFKNKQNYGEVFGGLRTEKERISFYMMIISSYVQSTNEVIVQHLGETATNKSIDSQSFLIALWSFTLHIAPNTEESKKLISLISIINSRNILQKTSILSYLPDWVAQGAGLLDIAAFQKRIARVYTKSIYEQNKYSLIRQNNEGYAKLNLLLINLKDSHDSHSIWCKILDLVGNFDLDPDRVLDFIIQAKMNNNQINLYMDLMKNFRKESIVTLIGNKMRLIRDKPILPAVFQKLIFAGPAQNFLNSRNQQILNELGSVINPFLINFIAKLIKDDLMSYTDLLPYLEPADHIIRHVNSKKAELSIVMVNKCFTLSMEEIDDNEKLKYLNEENLKFQGQLLNSSKLALITQLLRLNAWTDFSQHWSPYKGKIDLLLYQPLLKELLNFVQWAIEPLSATISYQQYFSVQYRKANYNFNHSSKEYQQIQTLDNEGFERLQHLLSYIGIYVGFRPKLFIKLCRILKTVAKNQIYQGKVKHLIRTYLIGGSCVAENNAPIAIQLFSLLQCYEYQFRYTCYLDIYRRYMVENPYVARIFQSIKRRQNIIVNNLSKENKKIFIRKVAKLTHNQALPMFYWIIRRIVMQDYEAVVPQIVAVLSNSSPMTLDMVNFIMLYTLNETKQRPVHYKTHQSASWFKNIITFISTFFRKYLQTDIQPIFDYILMKTGLSLAELQDEEELPGALLKLLHELLNKMHGSVIIQEVNKTKYDAISAGPRLQAEILQLTSQVRAAKKSKVILQKFFWQKNVDYQMGNSLAFNLLVLLAQKRAEVFNKSFIDDIKIIGQIYDEYSLLIIQIVRVLQYQAQDENHYAQLLPKEPLKHMFMKYKLPLEIVCEILRPSIKHVPTMTPEEFNTFSKDFTSSYAECIKDETYLVRNVRLNQQWVTLLNNYKPKIFQYISESFFTTFWFLSLDSIYFPAKSYSEKIQELKKKIEPTKKDYRAQKNEKQNERIRTLLEKLVKQQQSQRKKYNDTLSDSNLKKLQTDMLKGSKEKGKDGLKIFAELFVQVCLLPRMMIDRTEALYCVKFTLEMIKANKLTSTSCIRLLTFLIEYVMCYLPFTTHREASNCISIYLSQILAIFNNWNDSVKLKQDLKRILNIDQSSGKDNYPKLKQYLVKLFQRVGNTVKSIKQQPYIIKNCLYLLEKIDSIPSYKEQADQLAQHMNQLKEIFQTVDMRTSLDRQIAMMNEKKKDLPDRPQNPEDKKQKTIQEQKKTVIRQNFIASTQITNSLKSPVHANPSTKRQPEKNTTQHKKEQKNIGPQISKARFSQKPVQVVKEKPQQNKKQQPKKVQSKIVHDNKTPNEQPVSSNPIRTVKEMKEQLLRSNNNSVTSLNPNNPNTGATVGGVHQNGHGNVGPSVSGQGNATVSVPTSVPHVINPTAGKTNQQNRVTAEEPLKSQKPASSAIEQTKTQPISQPAKTAKKDELPSNPQKTVQKATNNKEKEEKKLQKQDKTEKMQNPNQPQSRNNQKKDRKTSLTPQRKKDNSRWKDKDQKSRNERETTNKDYRDPKDRRDPKDFRSDRDNKETRQYRQGNREGFKDNKDNYSKDNKDNKQRENKESRENRERDQRTQKDREVREKERDPKDRERDTKDRERDTRDKERDNKDKERDTRDREKDNKDKQRENKDVKQKTNKQSRDNREISRQNKTKQVYVYNRQRKSQEKREQTRKQERKERQKEKERERRHEKFRSRSRQKHERR